MYISTGASTACGASSATLSTPWQPTDVSGLLGWWDSTDASTITDSGGGSVSQWDDKSGNNNHLLSNTGANHPQTGGTSQNGKNTIYFTNDYFSLDGTTTGGALTGFGSDEYTMFLLCKEYSARTTNAATISTRLSTAADIYTGKLGTLTRTYVFGLNTGDYSNSTTTLVSEDNWHAIVIRANSSGVFIDVDGTETQLESTQPNASMFDTFQVGVRASNGLLQEMELMQLGVYGGSISQADTDALIGWMANEAGI